MFFGGCVNIVAQSFSQLCRTKTAYVSRILCALGAPSTTGTDLQAFISLVLLISPQYFVIVIQTLSSNSRTVQGVNHAGGSFNFFSIITSPNKVYDLSH